MNMRCYPTLHLDTNQSKGIYIYKKKKKEQRTDWLGIRILYESTCLTTDCCFSELALKNLTHHVGLEQSGHHHHNLVKL